MLHIFAQHDVEVARSGDQKVVEVSAIMKFLRLEGSAIT